MMSYSVFFSPKDGVTEGELVEAAHGFLSWLQREQNLPGYRLLRVTDAASITGLPRFQAIVDFPTQAEFDTAMAFMRAANRVHEGPPAQLLHSITDFKVSFAEDA
ncbi:MAG: hypothetical protein RIS54_299 [Verrucomicrobiota bacterium]|jgi:hypothetical protein